MADQALEQDAALLAALWLDDSADEAEIARRAEPVLNEAKARQDPRPALLSKSYEAIRAVVLKFHLQQANLQAEAALDRKVFELEAAVREGGWWRAQQLMDAALSSLSWDEGSRAIAHRLASLTTHGPADQDLRPPSERFWTDCRLASLHFMSGDSEAAWPHLRDMQAASAAADHPLIRLVAGQMHSFVALSVGDVEGALEVLPAVLELERRHGLRRLGPRYNAMLACVLAGRHAEAAAVLQADPWMDELSFKSPALRALIAAVEAGTGKLDAAVRRLAEAQTPSGIDTPATQANRAWLEAEVWLQAGQPDTALRGLRRFLDLAERDALALTPINGLRLYQSLSHASEALGDLPGALQALKQAQAYSAHWLSDGLRLRLQTLPNRRPPAETLSLARHLEGPGADRPQAPGELPPADRQARFVAHVTHEMRNPLAGVLGMIALLRLSKLDDHQRRLVDLAQTSGNMLLALCNDVLDLAKLEAGRFQLDPHPCDPAAAIVSCCDMFEPLMAARGVALVWAPAAGLPARLLLDELRLQQLLVNLLGNAVKFTHAGQVRVEAGYEADRHLLKVAVIDTGPGLSPEVRLRLFEEFAQADGHVAASHGGTGLGLALCRALVTHMGGHIGVDSELGQGSRFWFEIAAPVVAGFSGAPAGP